MKSFKMTKQAPEISVNQAELSGQSAQIAIKQATIVELNARILDLEDKLKLEPEVVARLSMIEDKILLKEKELDAIEVKITASNLLLAEKQAKEIDVENKNAVLSEKMKALETYLATLDERSIAENKALAEIRSQIAESKITFDAIRKDFDHTEAAHKETIRLALLEIERVKSEQIIEDQKFADIVSKSASEYADYCSNVSTREKRIADLDTQIDDAAKALEQIFIMTEESERNRKKLVDEAEAYIEKIKKQNDGLALREKAVDLAEKNIAEIKNKAMIEIGKKARDARIKVGKELLFGLIEDSTN